MSDTTYGSAVLDAVSRAETLCVMVLGSDGRLIECNEGARRALGPDALVVPQPVWELLTDNCAQVLRDFMGRETDQQDGRLLLNFATPDVPAVSFSCDVVKAGESWVVFGERLPDEDLKVREELLELTLELSSLARERAKLAAQLASTLADLKQHHWNIRRLQEFLPICAVCHKVRNNADAGEAGWKSLTTFLLENGLVMSHGYCPQCEAAAAMEIGVVLAR